jgi:hypothetical protein
MAVREDPPFGFERLLEKHPEWIVSLSDGSMFPVRSTEISITESDNEIIISFPTDIGMRSTLPSSIKIIEDTVLIEDGGADADTVEEIALIPRIGSKGVRAEINAARLFRTERIASALQRLPDALRTVRFNFASEGGQAVTIFCEDRWKRQHMAIADISDSLTPEYLLTTLLLKMNTLDRRCVGRINPISLILNKKNSRVADELVRTLRPDLRNNIRLFEIDEVDGDELKLASVERRKRHSRLSRSRVRGIASAKTEEIEALCSTILELSPECIDIVFSSAGWTLRFRGLAFLRIRELQGRIRCWLGVGERKDEIAVSALIQSSRELINSISEYRRNNPPTRRHEYYRLASEAWLESLLLRDITRLDPNLIIAPVYNQFRSGSDRIDILALRSDGRPVIIEVKVACDREALFQTLDYRGKLESARRRGTNQFEDLFPGHFVRDEPPIIYIVAPFLSFHRDFEFLVSCIDPEIRICRFDLNEDWRRRLSIHRRTEY